MRISAILAVLTQKTKMLERIKVPMHLFRGFGNYEIEGI